MKWLLPLTFVAVYLAPLGLRPLWIPDEARYGEISREMLLGGDWVVPRLLGLRYFEKPVGGYWLNNLSLLLFGENSWALRFPTALACGLSALLVALLARRATGDNRKGAAAALVYLSSVMVLGLGMHAVLDTMLALCLTAGLVAFWWALTAETARRRLLWWAIFGAACGAAFLVKGFVAFAVAATFTIPFMLLQRRFGELFTYGWVALVVAVVVALPWSLAIHVREPDYWHYFFWVEHIQRFSSSNAQHAEPFWYYVPVAIVMVMPWTGAMPWAALTAWRSARDDRSAFWRYVLLAGLMPLLFFSISKGKMATYILPCAAPLAILIGSGVIDMLDRGRVGPLRAAAWSSVAVGGMGILALLVAQLLSGRPPYRSSELDKLMLVGLCLVAWTTVAALTVRRRIGYLTGLAILPVTVLPAALIALPASVEDSKMPAAFIEEHRGRIEPGAVLASTSISLSLGVAWEMRQTDIVIVGDAGELEYGLGHADSAGRRVRLEDFAAWLAGMRKERPVALFLRPDSPAVLEGFPQADWRAEAARFAILYYGVAR